MTDFFGFSKDAIKRFDLSISETVVLLWMKEEVLSGRNVVLNEKGCFSVVSYDTVVEELSPLNIKYKSSMADIFRGLVRKGLLDSIQTFDKKERKKIVAYKFHEGVLDSFTDGGDMKLIEVNDPDTRKDRLLDVVQPTFAKMFDLEERNDSGKKLFNSFDFSRKYSYIDSINKKLLHLYQGDFLYYYRLEKDEVYSNRAEIEKAKGIISSVKNDWNKVQKLLLQSAVNFSYWFDPAYEPLSKKWLAQYKNINNWLFNDFSSYSPFVLCTVGLPHKSVVAVGGRVKSSLPDDVQALGETVIEKLFPHSSKEEASQFWISISTCLKREKEIESKNSDDSLFIMRFHEEGSFVEKFLTDLPGLAEGLDQRYVSVHTIKGFLWNTWLQKMCDEDYISKDFSTIKSMYSED